MHNNKIPSISANVFSPNRITNNIADIDSPGACSSQSCALQLIEDE